MLIRFDICNRRLRLALNWKTLNGDFWHAERVIILLEVQGPRR